MEYLMYDSVTSNDTSVTEKVETQTELEEIIPPSQVQFWTYLIFQIPSLICTIFLLYHLLFTRRLRKALNNHVIIIFLLLTIFIEIIDNPLYIDAYRFGGHQNSFSITSSLCLMWWFIDFGFYGAVTVFLAWGSIERHILVFYHHQLLRTQKQKFFIHYFPLIIISIYLLGFYIGVIFFPPCENIFDLNALGCGLSPCYETISYLNTWDHLGNGIICTFIETISSIILLIRVVCQKRRLHQPINWQKHRKMAFQLLSISCLSLTIVFPQSLIVIIEEFGGPNMKNFGAELYLYLFYFRTFVVFLLPFICLGYLPELWPKLLFFKLKRRHAIGTITQMANQCQSILVQSHPS